MALGKEEEAPPCSIHALPCDLLARCLALATQDVLAALCRLLAVDSTFKEAAELALARVEEADLSPGRLPAVDSKREGCALIVACTLPRALARCPALRAADFSGSHWAVTDELLAGIAQYCGALRELRLNYCELFTTAGLEALASGETSRLEALSLVRCSAAVGTGRVLLRFRYLRELDVSWCSLLDPKLPAQLPSGMVCLNLQGCELLEDETLSALSMPQLTALNLSFTSVGNDGLMMLLEAAPSLELLTLSHREHNMWMSGRWTERGLAAFQAVAPHVHVRCINSWR